MLAACELLRPTWDATGGIDGYVSIEVDPGLAYDRDGTYDEAIRLHELVDRPNAYVKIPATEPGLGAIEDCIAAGRSINVTLIFSLERHAGVAEAYVRGLERLVESGGDPGSVCSVASFFVSRVDTEADRRLEEVGRTDLQGRLAIANAKLAYRRYLDVFSGVRWEPLVAAGATPQRCLWASTSTKNPAYRDVLYVEELIGPDTVNTMPLETVAAFQDHGVVRDTLVEGIDDARALLDELAAAGVDYDDVVETLEREGVEKFSDSFSELLEGIESKRGALVPSASRSSLRRRRAEGGQELRVEDAVRRHGGAGVDACLAREVREATAGFLDDDLHGREVPFVDPDRVDRTVDRALCDEHVRPEVAEPARVPGATRDRRNVVLDREGEHRVLDPAHGGHVEAVLADEGTRRRVQLSSADRARAPRRHPGAARRPFRAPPASPRRESRACSSASRRWGRRSSVGLPSRSSPLPRRGLHRRAATRRAAA